MAGLGLLGFWLLLVAIIAAATFFAVGMILLADRILSDSVSPESNSALSPFLTCVSLVFGALLGFTVVAAWGQYSSAAEHVTHEASTLTTMYRQTVAMPAPQQVQARALVRKYTNAVEGPEWSAQDASSVARSAVTEMYVLAADPQVAALPINQEFLSQLTVLTSDRNQRFLDDRPRIPPLLWASLILGAVVVVGLCGFMRLDSRRGHVLLSSAVAVLLGLMMFLLLWLDHPFGTDRGITSESFQQARAVFDAIDGAT